MTRYLVSVSGGRTSAVMAKLLKDRNKLKPVDVSDDDGVVLYTKYVNDTSEYIFVFANTSREDDRTLVFMDNVTRYWDISVVWVEAIVLDGRVGTSFKKVSFDTAKRDGSVFESVIAKYGIPNKKFPHCTRELKLRPITAFMKSIGWTDYITCIGYRADEPKRVNLIKAKENNQRYPLFEWGIKKPDVLAFCRKQQFDLNISEEEGNCKLCYKKSKRKLLTQIVKDPSSVDWVRDMETKYRFYEKEGRSTDTLSDGTLFFRDNQSIDELVAESQEPFELSQDILGVSTYDFDLDEQESCAESCEPFFIEP